MKVKRVFKEEKKVTNITIEEKYGLLNICNYGLCIIKDKEDLIVELLNEELKETTDKYTTQLISEILFFLKRCECAA